MNAINWLSTIIQPKLMEPGIPQEPFKPIYSLIEARKEWRDFNVHLVFLLNQKGLLTNNDVITIVGTPVDDSEENVRTFLSDWKGKIEAATTSGSSQFKDATVRHTYLVKLLSMPNAAQAGGARVRRPPAKKSSRVKPARAVVRSR